MPGLWQANGSHAECAREPGLQRTAHVWLQRMRGMGHGRKYLERSGPFHRAQINRLHLLIHILIVFLLTRLRPLLSRQGPRPELKFGVLTGAHGMPSAGTFGAARSGR